MKHLYLIGFRGCGKSTLGRAFAAQSRAEFLDLDDLFEARKQTSILDFVQRFGLEEFRRLEFSLLKEVDWDLQEGRGPTIVATGGGIVDYEPSREVLMQTPVAKLHIKSDAKTLWGRLEKQPERRKIGDLRDFAALEALLNQRAAHYDKIATFSLWNRDIREALDAMDKYWTSR